MSIIFKILITLPVIQSAVLNTCPANDLPKVHSDSIPEVGLNINLSDPVERHQNLTTPDGYILEMQRIPSGKFNSSPKPKPPVLVVAGIWSSSGDWVTLGPKKALAFLLADGGYDVWLGNYRGTTWSRKHVSLNPDRDEKFWDFSWHEMGMYDLPTKIDYILLVTGQTALHYIGHSQGGTALFVLGSERPEYNKKLSFVGALSPTVFMSHASSPMVKFATVFQELIEVVYKAIGLREIVPNCRFTQHILKLFCDDKATTQTFCSNAFFGMIGYDPEQLTKNRLMVFFSHFPGGASMKQLMHFLQLARSGRFCQFDYKSEKNLQIYGQSNPPDYNLSAVTAPVGLYYGANDPLVSATDSRILASKLPNLVVDYLISYKKFNQVDYVLAKDVRKLIFNKLLADMKNY